MQPDPTPDEVREQQRAAWRKAISKASKLGRTQRARRKPPPAKVGMHRKGQR